MVFSNKPLRILTVILIACLPLFGTANTVTDTTKTHTGTEAVSKEHSSEPKDETAKIREQIEEVKNHHVLDGHEFSILEDEESGAHYGFPLPIILWDNGIHFFSSSKFNHGAAVAESNGNFYRLHHEKIYKVANATEELTLDEHHHPTNVQPLDFSITKSVLSIMVVALLMFLLFSSLAKSFPKNGGISTEIGRAHV